MGYGLVMAGLPKAGKDLLTDGAERDGIGGSSEQYDRLAQSGVGTFGDEQRDIGMFVQQALHFLYLNLDATGTDDVVLTP